MNKTALLKEVDNITSQLIEKYKPGKIILFGPADRKIKVAGERNRRIYEHSS